MCANGAVILAISGWPSEILGRVLPLGASQRLRSPPERIVTRRVRHVENFAPRVLSPLVLRTPSRDPAASVPPPPQPDPQDLSDEDRDDAKAEQQRRSHDSGHIIPVSPA